MANDHYIPKFMLKEFTNPAENHGGTVWRLDTRYPTGKARPIGVSRVMAEHGLYDMKASLDNLEAIDGKWEHQGSIDPRTLDNCLMKREGKWAPTFKNVVDAVRRGQPPRNEEWNTFKQLMWAHSWRNPMWQEQIARETGNKSTSPQEWEKELEEEKGIRATVDQDLANELNSDAPAWQMTTSTPKIEKWLEEYEKRLDIQIWYTGKKTPGLVLSDTQPIRVPLRGGVRLLFVIAPDMAVWMGGKREPGMAKITGCDREVRKRINRAGYQQSNGMVVGRSESDVTSVKRGRAGRR